MKKINFLELKKNAAWEEKKNPKGAKAYFDDALWYLLPKASTPKHIMFSIRTTNANVETCDFRLTTLLDYEQIDEQCRLKIKAKADKKAALIAKDKKKAEEEEKKRANLRRLQSSVKRKECKQVRSFK